MIYYPISSFQQDVKELVLKIERSGKKYTSIYAVPQGGIPLGTALSTLLDIPMIDDETRLTPMTLIVDDLVDSGATMKEFVGYDFACIHVKKHAPVLPTFYLYPQVDGWITYWWEKTEERGIEDHVTRMIQYIGEDPTREGLIETPARVIKSWKHLYSGYGTDPASIMKTFSADGYDEMVLLKDIELYSMCEHHMLPFFGKAHVAYIPDKKVIGVSKIARLVEVFSRRLQIQERLGDQVTSALMEHLQPKGAACIIEAQHLCMKMRGVEKQNSVMVTSSLKGSFLEKLAAREELMRLIK